MLLPKRVKYRKMQKGRVRGNATRGAQVAFGSFGLKTLEGGWITARQIEAVRVTLSRTMKRDGKIWIRIFPSKPITKKPAETRMGSGKGVPEYWVAPVKPGTVMFEIGGVSKALATEALRLSSHKLPVMTKMVVRPDYHEEVVKK
ncbi:MAG: 50S ribosomal protein L16 [Ignavibacteriota bacterium]